MVSSKTFISIAPIVNAKPFIENRYQVIIRIPIPVLTGHKSVGIIGIVIACLLHIKGIKINFMAIIFPIKPIITNTRKLVIFFIQFITFYQLYYNFCIFISQGYQNITTCIHTIFIISINSSCITARIEKVFAITFPVNTFKIVIKPQRF